MNCLKKLVLINKMIEKAVVKKGKEIDGATGHYRIFIEKENLETEDVGGVFTKIIDKHYILYSYKNDMFNKSVVGVVSGSCKYQTLLDRLRKHVEYIGNSSIDEAPTQKFIGHVNSLDW